MAVTINTTFQGVPITRSRARGFVIADDIGRIAKDMGKTFENLTGKTAAGGGGAPATNTPHKHTEAGNLLYWPLMSQCFGSAHAPAEPAAYPLDDVFHPATFLSGVDYTEIIWYFPVFVPRGWAGKTFDVALHVPSGIPVMSATLVDSALATVSGSFKVRFRRMRDGTGYDELGNPLDWQASMPNLDDVDERLWYAAVTPSSEGLHAIYITASNTVDGQSYTVSDIAVFPRLQAGAMEGMNAGEKPNAAAWGTNQVAVGDSGVWHELDSVFYADDGCLDAIITQEVGNDAFMQELATGLPAAGNTALTLARGHDHGNDASGSHGFGASVEFVQGAWCFGARAPSSSIRGNGTHAPTPRTQVGDTGYKTFSSVVIQNPRHADTAIGTSRLYCAYVVDHQSGSDRMGLSITIGGTTLTDLVPAGAGYSLRQLGPFAYTSGVAQVATIALNGNDTKNVSGLHALMGFAVFFDIA